MDSKEQAAAERLSAARTAYDNTMTYQGRGIDLKPECQFHQFVGAHLQRPDRIIDPWLDSPEGRALTSSERGEMNFWICEPGEDGAAFAIRSGGMVMALCRLHYHTVANYQREREEAAAHQRRKDTIAAHTLVGNSRKYKDVERGKCKTCGRVDLVWATGWACPNRAKALAALDTSI